MRITDQSIKNAVVPISKIRPALRIQPTHGWTSLKLKELWDYQELLTIFTWRDLEFAIAKQWLVFCGLFFSRS